MDEDTILRLARKIRDDWDEHDEDAEHAAMLAQDADAWDDAMLEWLIDLITEYDIS